MGLKFRKSVKMGPVRINLSSSGVGYSVGTKGARISKSAKGKTKATFGIPGSGLSYSKSIGGSKKKNRTTTKAKASLANPVTRKTHASTSASSFVPHENSRAISIAIAIISFLVVAFVSFIALFILDVIIGLFAAKAALSQTAITILIIVPLILGGASSVFAYRYSVRENDKSE